jgi:rhodanese-related sulfurtransferase
MQKTDIDPQEAKRLLDAKENYIYLDVRTPAEFETGHVPGATNISFANIDPATGRMHASPDFMPEAEAKFLRDARLIVGCKSGGRSAYASEFLRRSGYTHVFNMVGGFGGVMGQGGQVEEPGWTTLGYPVQKGASPATTKPVPH